ncbi:hypothetical protein FACS1894167_03690 [Synergistales bacterium]|nr:hypothetical protein FACS1894167_03690 [Synergistales bacterium]GHV51945.1 hypothetical protein FACS1894216_07180 [Synergistales bacterium]
MKKYERNFVLFGDESAGAPLGTGGVLLYPFRKISVYSFAFPFRGISKVRDALRLQFRPLLGDGINDVSIIPFFLKSAKKSSSGCAFILFGDEASLLENDVAVCGSGDILVWPAPLAYAAEVGGSGLIIWKGCGVITAVWLDDWVPMYYRTSDAGDSTPEAEEEAAVAYIEGQGKSVDDVVVIDEGTMLADELQGAGRRTLDACPAYEQLDLSNRGSKLLERREKLIVSLSRTGKAAIAAACFMLILTGGVCLYNAGISEGGQEFAEEIYSRSFGETSRQPMSSVLAKMRSLRDSGGGMSFGAVMRIVSSAWEELGISGDITIDDIKYSGDNTDITGTALGNEQIQKLKSSLEAKGLSFKSDNTQLIPGGKLRFSISLSAAAKGSSRSDRK